ncbi:MAG: preprotein translocase subunit YajC [Arachnia propionica]|nr:MAG: preprotein translocase subunit YajC [Arachnia propionica]
MPAGLDIILMLVGFGALMYFMVIRPQQKRMREHQEQLAALAEGDRVLLASGVFATITHIGEKQAIVELAPGTEITILKDRIARAVGETEEEFEFAEDAAEDNVAEATADSLAAPAAEELDSAENAAADESADKG